MSFPKTSISVAAILLVTAMSGAAFAAGKAVGQDPTLLTQTRISNAGGGAPGNPHWGSPPHQNPWSGPDDINSGENYGEAFQGGNSATYNGYATAGEDAPWDLDPGNSGSNCHGGNAANAC